MPRRWRVFRPDSHEGSGLIALAYLALYVLSLGIVLWNTTQFDVVLLWPTNGVLLAACLQLPRRFSLPLLFVCSALNLTASFALSHGHVSAWASSGVDLVQVLVALVLTRRLCGASLDMRQPRRMVAFALGAALPAVALTALLNVTLVAGPGNHDLSTQIFMWRHLFLMEYLGLVTMTPCLLLIGQRRRDGCSSRHMIEGAAQLAILCGVVTFIFTRTQSALFVVFIPLMVLAYRLSPAWVGAGIILTAAIGGLLTLYGFGPVHSHVYQAVDALAWAPALMHQVPIYYFLMLGMTVTALPISALVTDRRRLVARLARRSIKAQEQSRLAREAIATKSRFLALVSHEMRTPLNSIQGFSEVLRARDDLAPVARHQVEAIAESGEALLVLIEDMLEASKGDDTVSMTLCQIDQVIRQAMAQDSAEALAKGLGVRLDLEALKEQMMMFDARRLRAALRQIMSNAVKFSHSGEIRISAWLDLEAEQLVIRVQDQGPGIAPGLVPWIFDPFIQGDDTTARQQGGTGIGLSAARRHARAMGGDVSLVTTSSRGSVFELRARVEGHAPPAPQPPEAGGGTNPRPPRRVLIVDDIDLNRSVMRMMIAGAGYQVDEAADGIEAVEKVTQSEFAVVLMDLRMPGIDGYEASRLIRQTLSEKQSHSHSQSPHQGEGQNPAQGPLLTIVAVTADSPLDLAPRLAEAGIDSHLPKPFTRERLLACLASALGEPSHEPQGLSVGE